MATARCVRFPAGEAHIRTAAGIVLFVDGVAEVEAPELVEALLEVPDEFGISVDGGGNHGPAPSTPTPADGRRPGKSAPVKAWQDWAVSHGMDPEAAGDLTKNQLIELADQLAEE